MKLIAILLLAGFIQVSAKGYSQLITVSGQNISLEKVFEKIERQTRYVFFYDEDVLQRARPVSIDVKNVSLAQVLDQCFRDQPLHYHIVGKTIVVNNIEPTQEEKIIAAEPEVLIEIRGKVKDENGNPLSGVTISIVGENRGVSTDGQGNFSINVTEDAVLSFSHVGYKTPYSTCKGQNEF